ncbi:MULTISPECIES: hypothetical protein [Priestia]|uniref:hypothetical protein n=1 Tax=Priestia TaxID=2800373 RepID=UPI0018A25ECF|nr:MULTISPECIES: hypothetical protein [Priestia]QTL48124.1 hypothetical protein J5Z55_18860 [Priestia aryabhattai]USL41055.1 hypothetical protein LIS78_18675 [Priestia megaterium]
MSKKLFDSLMNNKHRRYSSHDYKRGKSNPFKSYSSSGNYRKKRDYHGSYGYHHYKRKRKSGSFFSS